MENTAINIPNRESIPNELLPLLQYAYEYSVNGEGELLTLSLRFPRMDALMLDIEKIKSQGIIERLKQERPVVPIIRDGCVYNYARRGDMLVEIKFVEGWSKADRYEPFVSREKGGKLRREAKRLKG